jgi:hypothetical protein
MLSLRLLLLHHKKLPDGWEVLELVHDEDPLVVEYCLFQRSTPHIEERLREVAQGWREKWSAMGYIFSPTVLDPTTNTFRDKHTVCQVIESQAEEEPHVEHLQRRSSERTRERSRRR